MINVIGTDPSGHPLVLTELNEYEQAALSRILRLAEAHLGEVQFPKVHSRRRMAEVMIGELRRVYGIPDGPPSKENSS